jgi:hypothetical protein
MLLIIFEIMLRRGLNNGSFTLQLLLGRLDFIEFKFPISTILVFSLLSTLQFLSYQETELR